MQFSLKEGLRKYGKKGKKSVMKELGSLHDLKAWRPLDSSTLSPRQKTGAHSTVVFLKEARRKDENQSLRQWGAVEKGVEEGGRGVPHTTS